MAISIINSTNAINSSSKKITFTRPSGVKDGDMFVAVIGSVRTTGAITCSGWVTAQNPDKGSPDRQVRLLYRRISHAGAEPLSYVFETKDAALMQGIILCLRGADTDTPTFVRQGQGDDEPVGSNGQCPSVTTTFDEALILACMVVCDLSGNPSDTWGEVTGTPTPTNMLDIPANYPAGGDDHAYIKLGVAVAQQATAGTTSGYSWAIPSTIGHPHNFRDGAEMAMTVAIKSDPDYVPGEDEDDEELGLLKNIPVLFDGVYYPLNYNPVHAIWQCLLTVGIPEDWLDPDSFLAAAITVHSEGIGVSVLLKNHQASLVYIKSLLAHINGIVYYGVDGKLHIKLVRDDYDVGTIPVVTVDELIGEPTFERGSWIETIGEIKIQYNQITVPTTSEIDD